MAGNGLPGFIAFPPPELPSDDNDPRRETILDAVGRAAAAIGLQHSNGYYQLPDHLKYNADDAITTNPSDYAPGGRTAFDPDRRIDDLPNHHVKREQDMHKSMVRAMVARSMTRSEVMNNPKAIEAANLEWSKLRNKKYIDPADGKEKAGAWDESLVREFRDVKQEYYNQ